MIVPIYDLSVPSDLESDEDTILNSLATIPIFVNWLSNFFGLLGEPPSIEIRHSDQIEAYASEAKITITSGVLFAAARAAKNTELDQECKTYLLRTRPNLSPQVLFLLWVTAHEFFHVARGHHQVLSLFPGTERLLEYDADCMATAALFRFLRGSTMLESEDFSLTLRTTYYSIFWPIRAEIGSNIIFSDSVTHPHFTTRLYYSMMKLSAMWNGPPPQNYADLVSNNPSPEMTHEAGLLCQCAMQWEHQYAHERGGIFIEKEKRLASPLTHEFLEMATNHSHPLYELLRDWEQLYPEVKKASRLQSS